MDKHPFTVVGYVIIDYAPEKWVQYQGFCEWAWAEHPTEAEEAVSALVIDRENADNIASIDTVTCAVLPGHHEDVSVID